MALENYTRLPIGVVAIVRNANQDVLLQRRADHLANGAGKWALPGGRLESGETPDLTIRRELTEELGLFAYDELWPATFWWGRDAGSDELYLVLCYEWWLPADQQPQNLEPGRCQDWGWFAETALPPPNLSWGLDKAFGPNIRRLRDMADRDYPIASDLDEL